MPHQSATYSPRHVVILANPNPGSICGLVADAYCDTVRACGQDAIIRDLYELGFNPSLTATERPGDYEFSLCPDVIAELDAIRSSDIFVLIFPIWFGMPPAMLIGYIQRVLGAGVAVKEFQKGASETFMHGKRLVSICTSGTSKTWLNEQRQVDALKTLLGDYLVHGLGFSSHEDILLSETTASLDQMYVDKIVDDVAYRARAICGELAAERAGDVLPARDKA